MWERKTVNNWTLKVSIMLSTAFVCGAAYAAPSSPGRSRTVGELLKKIETEQLKKVQKSSKALPKSSAFQSSQQVNLRQVKPPSSSQLYYEEGTDEAEL